MILNLLYGFDLFIDILLLQESDKKKNYTFTLINFKWLCFISYYYYHTKLKNRNVIMINV